MTTLLLALRNLLRNRRRSLMTLIAMVIGVVTILLFAGYSRNITYQLQTGYVQRSGHLQVQHKDYFLYGTGNPAAFGMAGYQRVIDVIAHDAVLAPMVHVVTPTLSLGGIAGNFAAGVSRTVIGTGVVVENQKRMLQWNEYRLAEALRTAPLAGTPEDAVVIGTGVARVLQLCRSLAVPNCPQPSPAEPEGPAAPADIAALARADATERPSQASGEPRIELLAANVHGAPNVASLRVFKAVNQGIKEFDDIYVGLHFRQAQRLLYGSDAPQATAVVVQLEHTGQIPAARARLQELLATQLKGEPLEIHDFEALNPFYGQAIGMFAAIFGFMSVLIGAIVLFSVGNTMGTAVVERTTEIGTLRAVGLRRSGIRRLFIAEGALLGVIGAIVGVAIALGLAWLVNQSGLTWQAPGQVDRVPLRVRVWGETALITGAALGLICVAVVSAWWPARRAARLNIVDALRHV